MTNTDAQRKKLFIQVYIKIGKPLLKAKCKLCSKDIQYRNINLFLSNWKYAISYSCLLSDGKEWYDFIFINGQL